MCNLLWLESLFTISTAIPHTTFFKHTAATKHICPLYWDFAQDQTCSDERASLVHCNFYITRITCVSCSCEEELKAAPVL